MYYGIRTWLRVQKLFDSPLATETYISSTHWNADLLYHYDPTTFDNELHAEGSKMNRSTNTLRTNTITSSRTSIDDNEDDNDDSTTDRKHEGNAAREQYATNAKEAQGIIRTGFQCCVLYTLRLLWRLRWWRTGLSLRSVHLNFSWDSYEHI